MEVIARRPDNGNGQEKMVAFMRLHPPTFDSSEDDPLVADDWLRTITKKLNVIRATSEEKVTLATHQLVGSTGEWRENYQDAVDDPEAITWEELKEEFRNYHIPEGIMEMKAEEFCYLRQGAMTRKTRLPRRTFYTFGIFLFLPSVTPAPPLVYKREDRTPH